MDGITRGAPPPLLPSDATETRTMASSLHATFAACNIAPRSELAPGTFVPWNFRSLLVHAIVLRRSLRLYSVLCPLLYLLLVVRDRLNKR